MMHLNPRTRQGKRWRIGAVEDEEVVGEEDEVDLEGGGEVVEEVFRWRRTIRIGRSGH
jgi:hypothetical protein